MVKCSTDELSPWLLGNGCPVGLDMYHPLQEVDGGSTLHLYEEHVTGLRQSDVGFPPKKNTPERKKQIAMEKCRVSQMPALATSLDGSSASKDIWSDVEPRCCCAWTIQKNHVSSKFLESDKKTDV